jgi:hypothetical protein
MNFCPIEAGRNEIRLAADCTGSQISGLAAAKGWNASPDLHQDKLRSPSSAIFAPGLAELYDGTTLAEPKE